eukprot:comp22413_c0_seq1/m.54639 comp22413_c0_seq1/g.54639  ORF comp22413_c0_seq1/g.54639 comp22413_c0_seq1/m.54639 type:complete len:373 (+) comp22413_c0_seq1:3044-4162(+)
MAAARQRQRRIPALGHQCPLQARKPGRVARHGRNHPARRSDPARACERGIRRAACDCRLPGRHNPIQLPPGRQQRRPLCSNQAPGHRHRRRFTEHHIQLPRRKRPPGRRQHARRPRRQLPGHSHLRQERRPRNRRRRNIGRQRPLGRFLRLRVHLGRLGRTGRHQQHPGQLRHHPQHRGAQARIGCPASLAPRPCLRHPLLRGRIRGRHPRHRLWIQGRFHRHNGRPVAHRWHQCRKRKAHPQRRHLQRLLVRRRRHRGPGQHHRHRDGRPAQGAQRHRPAGILLHRLPAQRLCPQSAPAHVRRALGLPHRQGHVRRLHIHGRSGSLGASEPARNFHACRPGPQLFRRARSRKRLHRPRDGHAQAVPHGRKQ